MQSEHDCGKTGGKIQPFKRGCSRKLHLQQVVKKLNWIGLAGFQMWIYSLKHALKTLYILGMCQRDFKSYFLEC